MKRLLTLLSVVFVALVSLFGCSSKQTRFIDQTLIPLAESLTLNDKEIVTNYDEEQPMAGSACLVAIDEQINFIFYEDEVAVYMTFYLGSNTILGFNVWSFDVEYVNIKESRYVYYEFMHSDYNDEHVDRSIEGFVNELIEFKLKDVEYLISRLDVYTINYAE